MEANIIQIVLTLLAVAVIGGMKFYEKKYGDNPEAWDMQKFAMFMVVAFVIMVAEYLYGNTIAFPAEDILVPAMALFGMAYTLITGGKLVNGVIKNPTAASVPDSTIYDPAQHDNQPVWSVPWEQMQKWVSFKVSDATKANMLAGVVLADDRATIISQIEAAEKTNEYLYTIHYSKGYFQMKAVAEPYGQTQVKYQVLVSASGHEKE